ncbi:hypothetical protein H6G89_16260 [Oscillatoria sp. FACHB-1407]|uniref:DUF5946 family protein n=1 Tax=Oscillatoria sp. FACHB-1407 TaxID=2692847 RepID=UPI001688EC31|nr:DUF5946 family protein [Oscillatoria sp. FACHB-1407]MBD2462595.1 hypothetical protein [Oscillatoria sp. FACHB-1407]
MQPSSPKLSPCLGCGAMLPVNARASIGATHDYLLASAECWATFGEVLAREYSNAAYAKVHRLTVDAYAVQHPGHPSPQSIQSVTLHLISLCLVLECGFDMDQATRTMQRLARHKSDFVWLTPPNSLGDKTILDVWQAPDAIAHVKAVEEWAQSAWSAWESHHPQVRQWTLDWALNCA